MTKTAKAKANREATAEKVTKKKTTQAKRKKIDRVIVLRRDLTVR